MTLLTRQRAWEMVRDDAYLTITDDWPDSLTYMIAHHDTLVGGVHDRAALYPQTVWLTRLLNAPGFLSAVLDPGIDESAVRQEIRALLRRPERHQVLVERITLYLRPLRGRSQRYESEDWAAPRWPHEPDLRSVDTTTWGTPFWEPLTVDVGWNVQRALYYPMIRRRPDLLQEWDWDNNPSDPWGWVKVTVPIAWRCQSGHPWQTDLAARYKGSGCPVCSGQKLLAGVSDLLTVDPALAAEFDSERNHRGPDTYLAGSNEVVFWNCARGHTWRSQIVTRRSGSGCPYCAGLRAIRGETDLATRFPDIAAQFVRELNHGVASDYSAFSGTKAWWRCDANHTWEATVASRSSGSGCPSCSNRRLTIGWNDLATTRPDLVGLYDHEGNEDGPEAYVVGSAATVWWRCDQGHSWRRQVRDAVRKNGECPYCCGRKVLPGFNDLGTLRPHLASEFHPSRNAQTTDRYVLGSATKVWWVCSSGHEWSTEVRQRALKGTGCPECYRSRRTQTKKAPETTGGETRRARRPGRPSPMA